MTLHPAEDEDDEIAPPEDSSTEHLLAALTVALQHLGGGSSVADRKTALRTSFVHAREGLQARKALLLYVGASSPLELEILEANGLTGEQEQACRRLESCDGVSPSVIRQAIDTLAPVWIANAQERGAGDQTRSLAMGSHSVLCAPILEPLTSTVLAVLYFQNQGAYAAFQEKHLRWLSSYAMAISHGLGIQLSSERRIQELSARLRNAGKNTAPEIVGESAATRRLREVIEQTLIPEVVDRNPKPILILGPTGTGKEVIARYLHYYSTRAKGPFVALNCAGLASGNATKSALFGHVRGAFTDAYRDEPGAFRAAHKGILFLDEIGEMPLDGQAELLRAIQERRITPLGSTQALPVDVQLVAATNKDIPAQVSVAKFRDDLYYRINVHTIRLGAARVARAWRRRPPVAGLSARPRRARGPEEDRGPRAGGHPRPAELHLARQRPRAGERVHEARDLHRARREGHGPGHRAAPARGSLPQTPGADRPRRHVVRRGLHRLAKGTTEIAGGSLPGIEERRPRRSGVAAHRRVDDETGPQALRPSDARV